MPDILGPVTSDTPYFKQAVSGVLQDAAQLNFTCAVIMATRFTWMPHAKM